MTLKYDFLSSLEGIDCVLVWFESGCQVEENLILYSPPGLHLWLLNIDDLA